MSITEVATTKVVVVDDHPLMRRSIAKLVERQEGFELVGEAERADEAYLLVGRTQPDMILLDVAMPDMDGIDLLDRLRREGVDIPAILITMHEEDGTLRRALAVGAEGYVPKNSRAEEVVRAMTIVAEGGTYLSPSVAKRMMDLAAGRGYDPIATLTDRELEVLRLLAAGHRNRQMADELFVSVKTIKNHLTSVYAKLHVETAAQAVSEAYRLGIATSDDTA